MVRFLKFLLAVFLLPTLALLVAVVFKIVWSVLGQTQTVIPFAVGAGLYIVLHYTVYNFSRFYVFIHEMTHAFAAWLCGYHVSKISVKKDSGFVKMDKTNTFVVLAPYFVAGYVWLGALVYGVASLCTDVTPYRVWFLGYLGFFMAFHFVQTFHTLWEADQPDLKLAGGKVFSLVTIVLVNLAVLAVSLKILFPQEVPLGAYLLDTVKGTLTVWRIIVNYIVEVFINTL